MTKRRKSERSEAQIIADKHNGNCFCLEGIACNIERVIVDCADVVDEYRESEIQTAVDVVRGTLRRLVEEQYEYEKDKAGKPTPAVRAVDK